MGVLRRLGVLHHQWIVLSIFGVAGIIRLIEAKKKIQIKKLVSNEQTAQKFQGRISWLVSGQKAQKKQLFGKNQVLLTYPSIPIVFSIPMNS